MRSLGPRASFWTAAVVAGLALWASAAPTVVYPLYAVQWNLTATVTTAIFAVYPLVLIPVLLVFGNVSDYIGRRAAILTGLAFLTAGAFAFALAPDILWVFIGRGLMAFGVGLSLSPATAAMIEFGVPGQAHRASSTTTAATATGLALATLVGGALVQYAPLPLHLSFWVVFAVILCTALVAWFLPRHTRDESLGRWRPRALHIPRDSRGPFVAGSLAIAAAYSVGAIFLALGAQIARELVQSTNALVDGAVISVSAVVIGTVAILARSLPARTAVTLGPIAAALGLAVLIALGIAHSLPAFLVSSVLTGIGYSLMFSGGLGLLVKNAPVHQRAAVLSAAYVVAYALQAATALGLGAVATASGLLFALVIGSPVIIVLGVASLVVAHASRPARGAGGYSPRESAAS